MIETSAPVSTSPSKLFPCIIKERTGRESLISISQNICRPVLPNPPVHSLGRASTGLGVNTGVHSFPEQSSDLGDIILGGSWEQMVSGEGLWIVGSDV